MKTLKIRIAWMWFFTFLVGSILYYRPYQSKKEQDAALVKFMTHGYSKEQCSQFMEIAQQIADKQQFESIGLQHYEQAFAEISYGRMSKFHKFLNKRCKNIDAIAYHEAGHTLVTVRKNCGRELKWTSIQLCKTMLGYVYTLDYNQKTYRQKINTIVMLLAGGVSEQYYKGKKFKNNDEAFADLLLLCSARVDVQTARSLIQDMIVNNELAQQDVDTILKKYYAETVEFLLQHQGDLEVIAQALLDKKFLSCYETYELLYQSSR
jgi:ATP-dependent Zn protease